MVSNILLFGLIVGFLLGLMFMESSIDIEADAKAFTQIEKEYPIVASKAAFQFGKSLNNLKKKLLRKK